MRLIQKDELRVELAKFDGHTAYIHVEVNPGALLRNIQVSILQTHVAGEGLFRAAVQTNEGGWIRAEGLTHMNTERSGRLLLAGHDASGRITAALQLSLKPFDFEQEGDA